MGVGVAHGFAGGTGSAASGFTRLCVLRTLALHGPWSAREVFAVLRPLEAWAGFARPGYPLLHELVAQGLLVADPGRPPRYGITDAGRQELAHLQRELLPEARRRLEGHREALVRLFGPAVLDGVVPDPGPAEPTAP